MKKIILAVVAFSFVVSGTAWAKVTPNLDAGTKQLRIYGSWDNNHPLDYQLTLGGGFGFFIMDNLELGAVIGWESNDLSDTLEAGIVAEYNFTTGSPWVPFVKAGGLYAGVELDDDVYNVSGRADEDAFIGRLGGGVKYFFRDEIAIGLSVNYDLATEDLYPDDDGNMDNYNIQAVIGLEFYFD